MPMFADVGFIPISAKPVRDRTKEELDQLIDEIWDGKVFTTPHCGIRKLWRRMNPPNHTPLDVLVFLPCAVEMDRIPEMAEWYDTFMARLRWLGSLSKEKFLALPDEQKVTLLAYQDLERMTGRHADSGLPIFESCRFLTLKDAGYVYPKILFGARGSDQKITYENLKWPDKIVEDGIVRPPPDPHPEDNLNITIDPVWFKRNAFIAGKTPAQVVMSELNTRYTNANTVKEKIMEFVRDARSPQMNKPCPCGSGKKYKKCCLNKFSQE